MLLFEIMPVLLVFANSDYTYLRERVLPIFDRKEIKVVIISRSRCGGYLNA